MFVFWNANFNYSSLTSYLNVYLIATVFIDFYLETPWMILEHSIVLNELLFLWLFNAFLRWTSNILNVQGGSLSLDSFRKRFDGNCCSWLTISKTVLRRAVSTFHDRRYIVEVKIGSDSSTRESLDLGWHLWTRKDIDRCISLNTAL